MGSIGSGWWVVQGLGRAAGGELRGAGRGLMSTGQGCDEVVAMISRGLAEVKGATWL
jgi:hypothetical protein